MEPMWRPPTNPQILHEMDAYVTRPGRHFLWLVVFAAGFAVAALLLWGPGPLPKSVHFPIWLGASITAVIGVPPLFMMGVGWVHLIQAANARGREGGGGGG